MSVKDLLDSVTFEQVAPYLWQIEDEFEPDIESYRQHFEMLRSLEPQKGVIDVCYIAMEYDYIDCKMIVEVYPIAAEDWEKVLGMKVLIASDVKASRAEIVARCIWRTAMYGFTLEQKNMTLSNRANEFNILKNRLPKKKTKKSKCHE
jgi:hypothetical protein